MCELGVRHKFNEGMGHSLLTVLEKIFSRASLLPANKEPIITQEAPMASALVAHPVELIPPSAMTGMPCLAATAGEVYSTQPIVVRP